MKFGISKQTFIVLLVAVVTSCVKVYSQEDPLPSWNEGHAKKTILEFVKEVVDPASTNFVPPSERIATFDQDGTLWVEQPLYSQLVFATQTFEKMPAKGDPELLKKLKENPEELKALSKQEREELLAKTHSGMTVNAFYNSVRDWLKEARHPRFKRSYTDLIYQPMLEVIQLLKNNEFKVYIVSGGGQDFIRVFSESVYGIPPEQVIGSAEKVKYEYQNQKPVLVKLPQILFIDDKEGKPQDIHLFIGRRPIAAFGNSDGDRQMLEWTQFGKGKSLELLVYHDDAEREYAYGADSKIGTFSNALRDEAKKNDWIIISMKKDWKVIFPWEKIPLPMKQKVSSL